MTSAGIKIRSWLTEQDGALACPLLQGGPGQAECLLHSYLSLFSLLPFPLLYLPNCSRHDIGGPACAAQPLYLFLNECTGTAGCGHVFLWGIGVEGWGGSIVGHDDKKTLTGSIQIIDWWQKTSIRSMVVRRKKILSRWIDTISKNQICFTNDRNYLSNF